jgi:fructose/tagatose bisphosphate aldolase
LRKGLKDKVHLVLHGTNGFPEDIMKKCIAGGMCKVNVNRLVLDDYYEHLTSTVGKVPHTVLLEQGVQKVVDLTVRWMEICGSAGKA